MALLGIGGAIALSPTPPVTAQVDDGRAITVRSDIQEADQTTGVVTARGNVRIDYPARQMQATAAQAQYFSRERRIVLTGNVYVLQEGNSIRGERVVYLIDEGRFVATPPDDRQVESIYIISDPDAPPTTPAPQQGPVYNPKPAFKEPISDVPQPTRSAQ
jgi:lipopolysaccharide export system protein LptA